MYAYTIAPNDAVSPLELAKDAQRHKLAYWRKHHDLHGWMEVMNLMTAHVTTTSMLTMMATRTRMNVRAGVLQQ